MTLWLTFTFISILASAGAGSSDPAAEVRVSRWREDLAMLRQTLPARHMNLFWRTPRAVFDRQLDSLDRSLALLSDGQIVAGMTRACAIADAHTRLHWSSGAVHFRRLPFHVTRFEEGWYVLATKEGAHSVLGSRVHAIDGMPIDRVVVALEPFVAHDNQQWLIDQLPEWISVPDMLYAAGVARDTVKIVLSVEDSLGQRTDCEVRSLARMDSTEWRTYTATAGIPRTLAATQSQSYYWFRWLPDSRTMFIRYNRCADVDTLPVRAFSDQVLAAIDSLRAEKVVVDLRANSGGRSSLLRPLIDGLGSRKPGRSHRVYVLTGRKTFSSAVMNADELRRAGATVVGEATGGAANAYGEVKSFVLPHSGVRVDYSTRYFPLVSKGDGQWVAPDVPVPLRWEDWRRGRDAALEKVLSAASLDSDRGAASTPR